MVVAGIVQDTSYFRCSTAILKMSMLERIKAAPVVLAEFLEEYPMRMSIEREEREESRESRFRLETRFP